MRPHGYGTRLFGQCRGQYSGRGPQFWQVGSSATLGTGTQFEGNILADASVTLDTGARLVGRALALNGAVVIDTNGTDLPITNTPNYHILFLPLITRP